MKGAISNATHTQTWWKHFLSSLIHLFSLRPFPRVSCTSTFPFVPYSTLYYNAIWKHVANSISYAWRWIDCLFSIRSLLTLTRYVSLTKWKINMREMWMTEWMRKNRYRYREDALSFPFHQRCNELCTHWMWTKLIHFNRNNWFNVKRGKEYLFFLSLSLTLFAPA